jgi:hypothetical protein
MSVRKFRTLAEAGRTIRIEPGTGEFSNALRAVFQMASRLAPPRKFPPGVYKFRNMEEARAQKLAWARKSPQQ